VTRRIQAPLVTVDGSRFTVFYGRSGFESGEPLSPTYTSSTLKFDGIIVAKAWNA
jgi:hypothetical protein